MMFLLTTEDDDGMWIDEPEGYDSETEARLAMASRPAPGPHTAFVIYRCSQVAAREEPKP